MDGSSCDEDSLSSVLRGRGIEEGKLDGNRSCDEQNPGSVLRRGIKFSSADELLNFLNEVDEVNDESSLSDPSSGSFEVEEDKKQSDLRCKSAVVKGGTAEVNEVNAIEEGVADEGGVKKKECGLCGKKLRRENLRRHIREVHHQKEAEVHLEEIDQEDFKKHIMPGQAEFGWKERKDKLDEDNKSGWPECGLCGKKYSFRGSVKKHIFNVHLGEVDCEDIKKHILNEFECEQCSKKFSRSENLRKHIRVHQKEAKVNKSGWPECGLCGKKYSSRGSVKKHILNVHLEEVDCGDIKKHILNEFECEQCSKKLSTRENLRKHIQMHQKEAEVDRSGWPECGLCGKKYYNRWNVKKHILDVHLAEVDCEDIKKHILPGQHENSKERNEVGDEKKKWDPMCESETVEGGVAEEEDSKQADVNQSSEESGLTCNHCCKLFNNIGNLSQHRNTGVYLMSTTDSLLPKS